MSRRAPDTFTRFTSTSPHAASKPPRQPNTFTYQPPTPRTAQPSPSASPPNETPAQKVARLRASHRAAAVSQLTPLDRIIDRGRRIADATHRFVTYSLIISTGVAALVSVYGLTSLIAHNRRQKRAWIEREMDRLTAARRAFLNGTATAEQLHLLEQERAGEEMARAHAHANKRRKEEGIMKRVSAFLGFNKGDMGREPGTQYKVVQGGERLLEEAVMVEERSSVSEESMAAGRVMAAIEEDREVGKRVAVRGGPLDQLAGNMASAVVGEASWSSWGRGRD